MLRLNSLRSYCQTINSLVMFFEGHRAIWKSAEQKGKAKSVWFVLPCQWKSPMVSLHMAGFPGKQIQLKICFASLKYLLIDSPKLIGNCCISLFLTLFLIFSAFPNHAWINIGDSFHFTNSHVFSRQQTCHQWNPEHNILCIWNCYVVADYVWCQVNAFFLL